MMQRRLEAGKIVEGFGCAGQAHRWLSRLPVRRHREDRPGLGNLPADRLPGRHGLGRIEQGIGRAMRDEYYGQAQ